MRVFSTLAVILVVALVVSFFVFFHTIGKSNAGVPQAQTNFGAPLVCASDNPDKSPVTYVQNNTVEVAVLNGTNSVGFAKAVGEALQNRNFKVTQVSSLTTTDKTNKTDKKAGKAERTTIYYGKSNIRGAYTLYANFPDAKLVMDNRQDALVSVVLGSTFNDLTKKESVPAADTKIKNIQGCTLPSKVDTAKLPADITRTQQ